MMVYVDCAWWCWVFSAKGLRVLARLMCWHLGCVVLAGGWVAGLFGLCDDVEVRARHGGLLVL